MMTSISPFQRAAPLTSRSAVSVLVFAVATGLWACDEPQPTGVRGLQHSNIDDLFDGASWTIGLELGLDPSVDSLRSPDSRSPAYRRGRSSRLPLARAVPVGLPRSHGDGGGPNGWGTAPNAGHRAAAKRPWGTAPRL
jgi:hypothetical protein